MEPVVFPIEDVLDLHTFRPAELPMLIEDYLEACLEKGFSTVRIIHGKGTGVLRERLHRILERSERVASFRLAPPADGGWGATIVELVPCPDAGRDSGLKCPDPDDRSQSR
jgi:dsDNA-specific endonuclease/ATPase MutS2